MYFDLSPKTKRVDLYNFDDEFNEFGKGLKTSRLVSIIGPRRTGKSSLLLTFLNEQVVPHIFLDTRKIIAVHGRINERWFMMTLSESIQDFLQKHASISHKFRESLKSIEGITVTSSSIRFSWGKKHRPSLTAVIESLNQCASRQGIKVVLAIDEAQELRALPQFRVSYLLAHIYDYMENIVVCLTGSQVGLIYDFLRLDDPKSPLYGRPIFEVKLGTLNKEESVDFLNKGFKQAGVKIDEKRIGECAEKLGGIIGWLTYYGWYASHKRPSLEKALDDASKLAMKEIHAFISTSRSPKRYKVILEILAMMPLSWSKIKRGLETSEGVEIDGSSFTDLINAMVKMGFVEKQNGLYKIADPVLQYALLKYNI